MRQQRTEAAGGYTMYPLWTLGVGGWAGQEVVGSFAYIPNVLWMLGGEFDPRGAEVSRTVELIPEPQNSHDPNAVSVRFQAKTIGYLPREDAVRYQGRLLELMAGGFIPTVGARIWASEHPEWDERGRERKVVRAQIHLYLASPDTMAPVNDPPAGLYTMLPEGGSVQVGKTGEHFEWLDRYRTESGTALVLVTLVPWEERTARTVKRVAEVRLDGVRIGQLTPAMSEKFLPAVDHLLARGLEVVAPAVVMASPVSATVSLRAKKAFELPPQVLNGPPMTVLARGIEPPARPATSGDVDPADSMPTSNSTELQSNTIDLDGSRDEVQTAVTASGSRITVTESPTTGLVTVTLVFAEPLTTWQSRIASEVIATGRRLMNGHGSQIVAPELTDTTLTAVAPLAQAQAFVDALIGIDDSDFTAAQHFTAQ
ncbi:HIRAN domain-containing protein [Nocardia sp. NPDC004582]